MRFSQNHFFKVRVHTIWILNTSPQRSVVHFFLFWGLGFFTYKMAERFVENSTFHIKWPPKMLNKKKWNFWGKDLLILWLNLYVFFLNNFQPWGLWEKPCYRFLCEYSCIKILQNILKSILNNVQKVSIITQ